MPTSDGVISGRFRLPAGPRRSNSLDFNGLSMLAWTRFDGLAAVLRFLAGHSGFARGFPFVPGCAFFSRTSSGFFVEPCRPQKW